MSYQDDDKLIFPTRTGAAIGSAAERQMLDNAQGSATISKRFRKNLDGSVTRLTTRAGNPEFITERDSEDEIDVCPLTDYGFVNSRFSVNDVYSFPEDLSRPIYNLFGADGLIKEAKHARNSVKRKRSLMLQAAPLFSGTMRRVVQLENGKKKGAPDGVNPIGEGDSPFYPGWATTDGLFIGATNSGTVTRFIIRIDAAGIWRIPIEFCKKLSANWEAKEAEWKVNLTPDQFHKKVAPYWTVVKLKLNQKVKIAPPPTCFAAGFAPFYEWCGWAFDYTGSKATVVCTGFKNPGDTWLTNRMYDITILSENGIPYYATETMSAEDKFVNIWNDGTPGASTAGLQVASILPGWLATYAFHDAIQHPASVPNQDTPVFSYYEKGGGKIVVKFFFKGGSSGTVVQVHQSGHNRRFEPQGEFKNSYFDTATGQPTTSAVSPYPSAYDGDDIIYSTGPVKTTTAGVRGTTDNSFYSPHVEKALETYSYNVDKIDLEDAGYGYRQNMGDGARLVGASFYCCINHMGLYQNVGGYAYPAPIGFDAYNAIYLHGLYRDVTYVWQVSNSYYETQADRTVLLLHGFDRESYAVARTYAHTTGTRTVTKTTNGSVAPCTVSPKGPLLVDVWQDGTLMEWTEIGNDFGNYPGWEPRTVVGNHVSENVIGVVVAKNTDLNINGGTNTYGPTNTRTMTITTRVGEASYTETITNNGVFLTYAGGEYFQFRACAAAWDMTKQVRQKEIGSTLRTENLGGCLPSANITSFIGVI